MSVLEGRVALITGASGGIGRGVAMAFASAGAAVAVNYPDAAQEPEARAAVSEITAAGGQAFCVRADVAQEEEVAAMVRAVVSKWGRLDVLVNNAGMARPVAIQDMTVQDWDLVLGVNLRGPFLGIKHALPLMLAQNYGRIINTASGLTFKGRAGSANYCASKSGLLGLTRAAVMEIGDANVTVNCVAPTRTLTPINAMSWTAEDRRRAGANIPRGRIGAIEDLIPCYLFLASEPSGYFTGQCLSPNGGDIMV